MSAEATVTGLLPFVVLIASLLSLPVSLFLLALYRRTVKRGMGQAAGHTPQAAEKQVQRHDMLPALQIETIRVGKLDTDDMESPEYRRAIAQPWRVTLVYVVAGILFSAVMTAGRLASMGETDFVPARILILFWTYLWTAVIAASLVAPIGRSKRLQLFALYFAALLGIMLYVIARNPTATLGSLIFYWLVTNGPATVLMQLFLSRPIRAVGPLVLAFMILVGLGSQMIVYVAERDESTLRAIAEIGFNFGLGAYAVFFGMILLGMIMFAALGWPILRIIARRYERKRMSEQSIILDSLWLVFALVQSIPMAFGGIVWILTGVLAFAAYKLAAVIGLKFLRRSDGELKPRTLLLLRVFTLGKRSELFFGTLRRHWPYVGSVSMIAGPDLVTTTVEPHEFLEFVAGRLSRRFVSSEADLQARVASMDTKPDIDGRYRVNEFFCRRDNWQQAMERLATQSDMVLMDLRSFGTNNQGCLFEIERLLDRVDLERVIFIIDPTTDRAFLESSLQALWRGVDAQSPNVRTGVPRVLLLEVVTQDEREIRTLLRRLLPGTPATPYTPLKARIAPRAATT